MSLIILFFLSPAFAFRSAARALFDGACRPASVPDIDPHWSYEGAIGGQTRSARARSSSFYEGDDEDMLACINGET